MNSPEINKTPQTLEEFLTKYDLSYNNEHLQINPENELTEDYINGINPMLIEVEITIEFDSLPVNKDVIKKAILEYISGLKTYTELIESSFINNLATEIEDTSELSIKDFTTVKNKDLIDFIDRTIEKIRARTISDNLLITVFRDEILPNIIELVQIIYNDPKTENIDAFKRIQRMLCSF